MGTGTNDTGPIFKDNQRAVSLIFLRSVSTILALAIIGSLGCIGSSIGSIGSIGRVAELTPEAAGLIDTIVFGCLFAEQRAVMMLFDGVLCIRMKDRPWFKLTSINSNEIKFPCE